MDARGKGPNWQKLNNILDDRTVKVGLKDVFVCTGWLEDTLENPYDSKDTC